MMAVSVKDGTFGEPRLLERLERLHELLGEGRRQIAQVEAVSAVVMRPASVQDRSLAGTFADCRAAGGFVTALCPSLTPSVRDLLSSTNERYCDASIQHTGSNTLQSSFRDPYGHQ